MTVRRILLALCALAALAFPSAAPAAIGDVSFAGCLREPTGVCGASAPAGALDSVQGLAFAPDGALYATASNGQSLTRVVRDPETGAPALGACIKADASDGACPAGAPDPYLALRTRLAVSPDGAHVYTGGAGGGIFFPTISVFALHADGAPTASWCYGIDQVGSACTPAAGAQLVDVTGLAVSPDGLQVYATGTGLALPQFETLSAVYAFDRDPTTGALTAARCWGDTELGCAAEPRAAGASSVAISPEGARVYVGSTAGGGALAVFDREAATGALTRAGCAIRSGGSLDGCAALPVPFSPTTLAAADDGVVVATASGNVVSLRVGAGGAPAFESCAGASSACAAPPAPMAPSILSQASGLAVTPDATSVYAGGQASSALVALRRDPADGVLSFLGCVSDAGDVGCATTPDGSGAMARMRQSVALSPDGQTVATAGYQAAPPGGGASVATRALAMLTRVSAECASTEAEATAGQPEDLVLSCVDGAGKRVPVTIERAPEHGTLVALGEAGAVRYTPDAAWTGPDSIAFRAAGVPGTSGTAGATIAVLPAEPPDVGDDAGGGEPGPGESGGAPPAPGPELTPQGPIGGPLPNAPGIVGPRPAAVSLAVPAQRLGGVRRSRRIAVACRGAAAARCSVRISVTPATAKALGLKVPKRARSVTLGRASVRLGAAGRATARVAIPRRAAGRLARLRTLRLTIAVSTSGTGRGSATRTVTLRR